MNFSIAVSIDPGTLNLLTASGQQLVAMKAVQTPLPSGAPLVWGSTGHYLSLTQISWSDSYQAYASSTIVIPGAMIQPQMTNNTAVGQTLQVNFPAWATIAPGGAPDAITIQNTGMQTFTGGISEMLSMGGDMMPSPYCAVQLMPTRMAQIVPAPKVLLMFVGQPLRVGSVLVRNSSPAVLVDMGGGNQASVLYNANQGWSGPNARPVVPNSNLQALLLQ